MTGAPAILISPSTEREGAEFSDASVSLSHLYADAIFAAGGLPVILPAIRRPEHLAEYVRRADGILLTGGDDLHTGLYASDLPEPLARTAGSPDHERDAWELRLIDEIFKQHKPVLGICRGQQILNVALGGTLLVDIPTQVAGTLGHNRFAEKAEPVHEIDIEPGSLLAAVTGHQKLAVNSTHHQAVGRLAEPLRATARSTDGVIEAVELKDAQRLPFLLAVQFHPERLLHRNGAFLNIFRSFILASKSKEGTA